MKSKKTNLSHMHRSWKRHKTIGCTFMRERERVCVCMVCQKRASSFNFGEYIVVRMHILMTHPLTHPFLP